MHASACRPAEASNPASIWASLLPDPCARVIVVMDGGSKTEFKTSLDAPCVVRRACAAAKAEAHATLRAGTCPGATGCPCRARVGGPASGTHVGAHGVRWPDCLAPGGQGTAAAAAGVCFPGQQASHGTLAVCFVHPACGLLFLHVFLWASTLWNWHCFCCGKRAGPLRATACWPVGHGVDW